MAADREMPNPKQPALAPGLYEPKKASDREKPNGNQPALGSGLYETLKVPRDASARLIRSNYENQLALAKEVHGLTYDEPTPEDRRSKEAHIQKLHDAARVLLDPVRRRQYDMRLQHNARKHTSRQPAPQCDTWIAARDGRDWPTPPKHRERSLRRRGAFNGTHSDTRSTKSPGGRGSPSYEPYLPY
ncbi:hypothetical protein HII31_09753 [Pseudocercospora fuligena]|uniref:J domain-containing protein n=1 Tax=Pseudocercospora fuligena TaxID=685502 RepID=A0A8H6VEX2_9PEZI|nr:hypothetical protein HII31_09753 [Pseudocercospora fuligena]